MECIDAFCHIFPSRFFELMVEAMGDTSSLARRMRGTKTIYDLDSRFRLMDEFEGYKQIISLGLPGIEAMANESKSPELAQIANDGMAELVSRHPDRFLGYVGGLPMNAPEEAAKEAERILLQGNANGLQIHTTINGRCLDDPRFYPIFEIAAASNKPILLHPSRTGAFPDFPSEDHSRYEIWTVFGWPFETSATMARLVFSGVMKRFPKLKILTHHYGAMIPFFEGRMDLAWASLGTRGGQRTTVRLSRILASHSSNVSRTSTQIRRCLAGELGRSAALNSSVSTTRCSRPMLRSGRKVAEHLFGEQLTS